MDTFASSLIMPQVGVWNFVQSPRGQSNSKRGSSDPDEARASVSQRAVGNFDFLGAKNEWVCALFAACHVVFQAYGSTKEEVTASWHHKVPQSRSPLHPVVAMVVGFAWVKSWQLRTSGHAKVKTFGINGSSPEIASGFWTAGR
ncbi:hypothetical protein AYO20_04687 [Fonsecaea nubica]|uniref:Uncharacterized protein n=1 Tax=Fonsecaea nubica TaxID=856822 RepID=A0A178D4J5_9EURO|nr:hypothetical protein AYO20_04687 [Fonsecaea nubica]OAL36025.1 hypothetical protein AYO20_04687 [Fonsecaea nubica]